MMVKKAKKSSSTNRSNVAKNLPRGRKRSSSSSSLVLVVDDREEDGSATVNLLRDVVRTIYREPNDVTSDDLTKANVVLVDFKLDNWPQRNNAVTPSLRPQHGIALAANLRSNVERNNTFPPTAFALRSGKLNELSGAFSPKGKEHLLARMLDLDWVFSKADSDHFSREVLALAQAVDSLPHPWPRIKDSENTILELLKLPGRLLWRETAIKDFRTASPPQDLIAQATGGMAVIRWLLHEVLPYPSFLLDERYIAARLRIHPNILRDALSRDASRITKALAPYRYRGVLNDFLGNRWWRAGIDHWLWHATKGKPLDPTAVTKVVRSLISKTAEVLDVGIAVVALDDEFRPTDELIDIKNALQLRPDEWPSAAEPAWSHVDLVMKNPAVAARVAPIDKNKILTK